MLDEFPARERERLSLSALCRRRQPTARPITSRRRPRASSARLSYLHARYARTIKTEIERDADDDAEDGNDIRCGQVREHLGIKVARRGILRQLAGSSLSSIRRGTFVAERE